MLSIKLNPVERIRLEPWLGLGLGLGTQADALQLSETRSWYVVKSSSSILQTWTVIWILSMDPITFNDQVGYLTKILWIGILIVLHVRESHGFIHQTLNPYRSNYCFLWCVPCIKTESASYHLTHFKLWSKWRQSSANLQHGNT